MDSEEGASQNITQDGLSPHQDQYRKKESRSPQHYRRNLPSQQNFPGNTGGMFDPMMAMNMNMGMMNPLQFQFMTMQQSGMARPQHLQQQKHHLQHQQQQRPSESQAPPPGYVCHKCGQAGHWIYYCPNVPKGQYVPRHNSSQSTQIPLTEADPTPDELVCTICNELFRNASISLCCGKSFCENCIINALNETHQCPHCEKSASSDQVVPNKTLRKIVGVFIEERESHKEVSHSTDQNPQETLNRDDGNFEELDASQQKGSNELDTMNSNEGIQQPISPSPNDQRLANPPQQKHTNQQTYSSFDSADNTRDGHGRKQNTQGMDPMGRGFNGTPPSSLPFMANPAMFMGGNGAVPPFGFPDMSWMFGGNSAGNNSVGGRGGAFPPLNGMQMLPSFFGGNNGAPIHYPGGFSSRGRGTGSKNLANTQQHKQKEPQHSNRPQSDTTPYNPTSATGDIKVTDTMVADSGSSHRRHRQHDNDQKDGHDSTRSRHRSPHSRSSTSHHRDSRKRSRSRSSSPSERHSSSRRRYSNSSSSGHRKSHRSSRSPIATAATPPTATTTTTIAKHHHDDGDDIVDYGEDDFEEDEDEDKEDHHHRRHRRSSSSRHHRSGSSRRHHGSSSSTRHRSSSRHRHSDDYRKNDRYRHSSRDRSKDRSYGRENK